MLAAFLLLAVALVVAAHLIQVYAERPLWRLRGFLGRLFKRLRWYGIAYRLMVVSGGLPADATYQQKIQRQNNGDTEVVAAGGQLLFDPPAGITAFSGGGQASAVALTSMFNRVATAAAAVAPFDSVKLPASVVGLQITVVNRAANPIQVFGAGTDTINGIATATGISQGVATTALYTCAVAGNWEVPLTALQSTTPAALAVNGAIPPHTGHTYVITKAGVLADTLAAPTAGTDDGIEITITSNTAFAHTLTATGLLQTGSASVNVATFAAFAGAGLTLMAYGGKWNVVASVGITFS